MSLSACQTGKTSVPSVALLARSVGILADSIRTGRIVDVEVAWEIPDNHWGRSCHGCERTWERVIGIIDVGESTRRDRVCEGTSWWVPNDAS